jgi:hypothetical protein
MTVGLLFGRSVCMGMEEFMRAIGELKTTMEKLLVALVNMVRACFKWFFKLHQNFLLLLIR